MHAEMRGGLQALRPKTPTEPGMFTDLTRVIAQHTAGVSPQLRLPVSRNTPSIPLCDREASNGVVCRLLGQGAASLGHFQAGFSSQQPLPVLSGEKAVGRRWVVVMTMWMSLVSDFLLCCVISGPSRDPVLLPGVCILW